MLTADYDSNADFATYISLGTVREKPLHLIERCLLRHRALVDYAAVKPERCAKHPLAVLCTEHEVISRTSLTDDHLLIHTFIKSGLTRVVLPHQEDFLHY